MWYFYFTDCLTDFDYLSAQKKYLVKAFGGASDKGEFILPPNSRELLAFIFTLFVEIDAKRINFSEFLNKYFFIDGSSFSSYNAFVESMVKPFILAVKKYELIEAGDKIAVCISGGKDSMILAKLMQQLQKISDVPFELVFMSMDPGYNKKNRKRIEDNAKLMGIPIEFFDSNIFEVAAKTEKNPCCLK